MLVADGRRNKVVFATPNLSECSDGERIDLDSCLLLAIVLVWFFGVDTVTLRPWRHASGDPRRLNPTSVRAAEIHRVLLLLSRLCGVPIMLPIWDMCRAMLKWDACKDTGHPGGVLEQELTIWVPRMLGVLQDYDMSAYVQSTPVKKVVDTIAGTARMETLDLCTPYGLVVAGESPLGEMMDDFATYVIRPYRGGRLNIIGAHVHMARSVTAPQLQHEAMEVAARLAYMSGGPSTPLGRILAAFIAQNVEPAREAAKFVRVISRSEPLAFAAVAHAFDSRDPAVVLTVTDALRKATACNPAVGELLLSTMRMESHPHVVDTIAIKTQLTVVTGNAALAAGPGSTVPALALAGNRHSKSMYDVIRAAGYAGAGAITENDLPKLRRAARAHLWASLGGTQYLCISFRAPARRL